MSDAEDTITSKELCAFTGYTDRQHRNIAAKGFFPAPARGKYKLKETISGMFKYLREQVEKKTRADIEERRACAKARRVKVEAETGILLRQYVPRVEVLNCVQVSSEEMKRLLYAKFSELPVKLQGLDVVAVNERLRNVADEICIQFQQRIEPWTKST